MVFLGEPYPREVCFVDNKYVLFDDSQRALGRRASVRVAFNVARFDTGEVKVLEQGAVFFRDLVQVRAKYGLDAWAFEIKRHGAAKYLKTTYSILPERQLTEEQQERLRALSLHDLVGLYNGTASTVPPAAPVAAETGDAIVGMLKTMPAVAAQRFCQQFGVARIRDLPGVGAEEALAFVDMLGSEFRAETAAPKLDTFG